jgi:hypothetical protein
MYAVRELQQPLVDQPRVEQNMDERLLEDLEDLIRFRKSQVEENQTCHESIREELFFFENELDKLSLNERF